VKNPIAAISTVFFCFLAVMATFHYSDLVTDLVCDFLLKTGCRPVRSDGIWALLISFISRHKNSKYLLVVDSHELTGNGIIMHEYWL